MFAIAKASGFEQTISASFFALSICILSHSSMSLKGMLSPLS
jgi:hypothetical protein